MNNDVKIRDAFRDWPPRKWVAEGDDSGAVPADPRELRLLWFSAPDEDGWFSLTATDADGTSWSTYCRTGETVWSALERSMRKHLKEPLGVLGDVELEAPRPKLE
jgi:hypothetical protein